MGGSNSKKIRAALKKLKARKTITLDDVLSFADAAIEAHGEGELTREQDAIAELRAEVARLQLRDLSKTQLPVARDELKTAVRAVADLLAKVASIRTRHAQQQLNQRLADDSSLLTEKNAELLNRRQRMDAV